MNGTLLEIVCKSESVRMEECTGHIAAARLAGAPATGPTPHHPRMRDDVRRLARMLVRLDPRAAALGAPA
jgi:hypothetical protein